MLSRDGALSCIAAFLILLSTGFEIAWGANVMYIASYLKSHDSTVSVNEVQSVLTIISVCYTLGLVLSDWLVDRIGPKLTNLIGTLTTTFGFWIAALIADAWLFMPVFGVLNGFGSGISFMTGLNVVMLHFTKNRGKALGFCACGYGLSTLVFGLLFAFIVNPHNLTPDVEVLEGTQMVYFFSSDVSSRTPYALVATGVVVLILGGTGSLLMCVKEKPPAYFTELDEEEMLSQSGEESKQMISTVGQAIRQATFWKMFWILYCGLSFCMWVFCSFKSFGSLYIEDDHLLSYIGASGSIMNALSRVLFPVLLDYLSFIVVNKLSLVIEAVLAFTIFYSVQSELAYTVVVSLTFIIQASQFFPLTLLCRDEYGPVLGPKVFSYVAFGSMLACSAPVFYYWLIVKNFGYHTSFIIQGLQVLIGLLLTFTLKPTANRNIREVPTKA
jgi:MFS family permease